MSKWVYCMKTGTLLAIKNRSRSVELPFRNNSLPKNLNGIKDAYEEKPK